MIFGIAFQLLCVDNEILIAKLQSCYVPTIAVEKQLHPLIGLSQTINV